MIKNYILWRERAKKKFGGSGGSATVSSQFHIVHHKSNCCAEFKSCNSFMGWDNARFTFGFKKWHIRLPPLHISHIPVHKYTLLQLLGLMPDHFYLNFVIRLLEIFLFWMRDCEKGYDWTFGGIQHCINPLGNFTKNHFSVWLRNRLLISAVLELVLSYTEKSCIVSYYIQCSTNTRKAVNNMR